jgi:hypothetical protein
VTPPRWLGLPAVVLLVWCFATSARAEEFVGRVVDAATGETIAGAQVTSGGDQVQTDEQGRGC